MAALLWKNTLRQSLVLIFVLLINSTISDDSDTSTTCGRHRKPWHLISDEERMLFVTGFQRLRSNGILSSFARTHHLEGVVFSNIHKTSEFFFWHNYFVLEFETQIRNLGDEYKCFSMPYWDVTNDAIFQHSDYLPIFNSFVGVDGDINNNNCVDDDIWNLDTYTTEFLCAEDEIYPNCCLKRQRIISGTKVLPTSDDIVNGMKLKRFREFQDTVSGIHGDIHKFFAATNSSHMFSNNGAEDPLFVLLHSFIIYIRAMRTSCFNFDEIANDKIEDYIPYTFDRYITEDESINDDFPDNPSIKPRLDTKMRFAYISDADWSISHNIPITPRLMYDISTFGVSYELGTFWQNNELQKWCGNNINKTWFYNENDYQYSLHSKVINKANSVMMTFFYVIIGISCLVLNISIVINKYISCKNKQKNEEETNLLTILDMNESYGTV